MVKQHGGRFAVLEAWHRRTNRVGVPRKQHCTDENLRVGEKDKMH